MASRAAATAISAITEIWSLGRSGMIGRMISGSTMPVLSTTWREAMPDAFRMNSGDEVAMACASPAAMASALAALKRSA